MMLRVVLGVWAATWWGSLVVAQDDFTPGHVFRPGYMGEGCFMGDASYVWEASPQIAFLRIFADTEDGLCAPTGMIFTPDGTRLRVANYGVNTIMDFYPDGNGVVVYEVGDGISRPGRNNGMTFDRQGNFFVLSEGSLRIIKFPRDERLPQIFADRNDGIITSGGMTADAEGNIYVGQAEKILVFTPQGEPAVFDEFVFNADVLTLTIDDDDNLFAGVEWPNGGDRVYRYDYADATRWRVITEGQEETWGSFTLTMSPNPNELYMASFGRLYAIDAESGVRRLLPIPDPDPRQYIGNSGIAVYIPPRAGDLNYDKVVDLADFELFADCLAGPGITDPPLPCPAKRFTAADLTRDGDVDAEDFSRFQSALDRP